MWITPKARILIGILGHVRQTAPARGIGHESIGGLSGGEVQYS